MGTLYKDMSRIGPAPTLRRETTSLLANVVVVTAFFAVVIFMLDGSQALNASIGGVMVLALVARWVYAARRGDVAEH